MKINLICVGKIKEAYLRDAADEYIKRLKAWCTLNVVEIDEGNFNKSDVEIREIEGRQIKTKLRGYVIATAIDGIQKSSIEFAKEMEKLQVSGKNEISIILGGSTGLSEEIIRSANEKISFSKMTFPHQLFRVMMLEQIYRALSILNNSAYHK